MEERLNNVQNYSIVEVPAGAFYHHPEISRPRLGQSIIVAKIRDINCDWTECKRVDQVIYIRSNTIVKTLYTLEDMLRLALAQANSQRRYE